MVDDSAGSLRAAHIPWGKVVARANASILSKISSRELDAYLLSESSLFVYDNAAIMITCGTTTLIDAVSEILNFVPAEAVRLLTYERKNEIDPDAQPTSFDDDVARLNTKLPGETILFGDPHGNHVRLFHYRRADFTAPGDDITLEILMHDLGPATRNLFHIENGREGIQAQTGLYHLFPGFTCDDFVFDPVGYSFNGIGPDAYSTFHVTPEQECSYASLETNFQFADEEAVNRTIQKVLDIFQPASASILLFQSHGFNPALPDAYRLDRDEPAALYGYDIIFRNILRNA